MKVLQIHTKYRQLGGEGAVARAEADLLRRAGHDVVQFMPRNPDHVMSSIAHLALAPWNPAATRHVRRLVLENDPDLAHIHNTWFALSPGIFSAIHDAGLPVVLTLHNFRLICSNGLLFRDGHPCIDCVGTHPWHGVRHRCYRDSALQSAAAAVTIRTHQLLGTWHRHVDAFLALTNFARDQFIAAGLPAERISVKPNFTADPGVRPRLPSRSDAVLFAGRLTPEKGVEHLVRAWNEARPASLRLLIAGDGPMRRRIQELASPSIEMLGLREPDEIRHLMLNARAFAFPSRWYEMSALTVIEALAAGLPVLASRIGGIGDIVGDASPALVPPVDHSGWVTSLRGLAADDRLDDAGLRARARYEAHFSESVALGQLESCYEAARRHHAGEATV